jgi:hypothetical protein
VTVSVFNRGSESLYTARAKLTRHGFEARLGRFGRIGVRFQEGARIDSIEGVLAHRHGRLAKAFAPSGLILCDRISTSGWNGRFKGRIRFRGEDGYVRVRTRSAHGFMGTVGAKCGDGRQVHGVALDARSDGVRFEAMRVRPQWGSRGFLATEKEHVGEVEIRRLAYGFGPKSSFTFDPAFTSAHVEPPGPLFSGFADFASPTQWTGPLGVSFPGDPDVPLAGAGFSARLKRR